MQAVQLSHTQSPGTIAIVGACGQTCTRRDATDDDVFNGFRTIRVGHGGGDIQVDWRIFRATCRGCRQRRRIGIRVHRHGNVAVDNRRVVFDARDVIHNCHGNAQIERSGIIARRRDGQAGELIRRQGPGTVAIVRTGRERCARRHAGDGEARGAFRAIRIAHLRGQIDGDGRVFRARCGTGDRRIGFIDVRVDRNGNRAVHHSRVVFNTRDVIHNRHRHTEIERPGVIRRRRDRQAGQLIRRQGPGTVAIVRTGRERCARRHAGDGEAGRAFRAIRVAHLRGQIDGDRRVFRARCGAGDRRVGFIDVRVDRNGNRAIDDCTVGRQASGFVDYGHGHAQVERAGVIRRRCDGQPGQLIRRQGPGAVTVVGARAQRRAGRHTGDGEAGCTFGAIRITNARRQINGDGGIFRTCCRTRNGGIIHNRGHRYTGRAGRRRAIRRSHGHTQIKGAGEIAFR